jgi:hypothetical protein
MLETTWYSNTCTIFPTCQSLNDGLIRGSIFIIMLTHLYFFLLDHRQCLHLGNDSCAFIHGVGTIDLKFTLRMIVYNMSQQQMIILVVVPCYVKMVLSWF